MEIYNPFITAIKRNSVSAPMLYLLNHGFLEGARIIDFGAGRGFDVGYLRNLGFNVEGYDKYNKAFKDEELLNDYYDVLTCNYVFNVIPDWGEYYNTLQTIRGLAKNIYVSVRTDTKAIKPNWEYDDNLEGYWTGRSFQRFYDQDKITSHFYPHVKNILTTTPNFILVEVDSEL